MKKILSVTFIGLLCLSMLSMLSPQVKTDSVRIVGLLVLPTSQEEISLRQRIENLGFVTELIYEADLHSTDLRQYAAVIEAEPRLTRNGLSVKDLVENEGVNILFLEDGIDDIRYDYGGVYQNMPSGLYTTEILDNLHPITSDYDLGEDVRISYGSDIHDFGVVGLTNLQPDFPLAKLAEPSGYSDTIALGAYAPNGRMVLYGVVFDEERHFTQEGLDIFDKALLWLTSYQVTEATTDINPDTLNLKSEGKWVTAYIELPEGYDVYDIDITSIKLNDTIQVSQPTSIGDYDSDGVSDLMVKFDRQIVINWLKDEGIYWGEVTFTVTGTVADETFTGHDTVRIICPPSHPT